ncbi:MAG TPA: nitroreductase family protein [Paludibacter sp.]|nr:nitroreductase family protein [Paludibacter sp.]
MNSFFDLLKNRRSIRKYLPTAVEQDKITLITKAALMSPSSKRSNPWEFIVVQDTETLQKLAGCRLHGSQFLAESPLGVIVTADTTKTDVWMEDASIAAIIMQLQAQDLGLGSCWIQVYGRNKDDEMTTESYIRGLLDIPEHFAVLSIISIGYPNEERKPYDEGKLAVDKIHTEKF